MLAGLGPDRRLLFRGVKHVVALWATVLFALPALVQTREDDNAANPGVVGQPVFLNSVHVGAAVQDQSQLKLRYEPFRGAYIRPLFLLFTKCYANFTLETILDLTFRTLDLHLG